MITLQLFARYRELLDTDHEQLEYDPQLATVGELRDRLIARGESWEVLAEPRVMCARNQGMCTLSEPLTDGDEIAFFPPVTGG
jgi:sulfur-carrier protein